MLEAMLIILLVWIAFEVACQGVVGFLAACGYHLGRLVVILWRMFSVFVFFGSIIFVIYTLAQYFGAAG